MKFPISWLNDYVDIKDISADEFAHAMTMSGSKVEGVENAGENLQNVVVGKLTDVYKHPNADSLSICKVDVGSGEILQIVTGAPNVKTGDYVPVALHGAKLPDGTTIKKGKLRGEVSCGMLCSFGELGLTQQDVPYAISDGILIFDKEYPLGTDVKDIFSLNEDVVEFEITSNRPDCFSVLGLAREAAVTFDRPLSIKTPEPKECGDDINNYIKINVADTEKCPRYSARIIKNVKIAESPKWLKDRLELSGIRSINNIVDITNYVLLEYGQPMHAFDLRYIDGGEINVRRAKDGEIITTLDDQERKLDSSMLVICDKSKPVAVAGVMGGQNSEVKDDTTTILFESANFNASNVRITAKKLGLRTESSSRYEKGLDPNNTICALQRACQLVCELGAGDVVNGIIDIDASSKEKKVLAFRPDYINNFIGCDIPTDFMVKTLTNLGFEINGDKLTVPTFRPDIEGEADVAEEAIRMFGYDKIGSTPLRGESTLGVKTPERSLKDIISDILTSQGMYETITYSFTSPAIFDMIRTNDERIKNPVVISNPLGAENSIMRTTLLASMLDTLSLNFNQRNSKVKLFEISNVYLPKEGEKLPDEIFKIALGMYGDCDFYDMKGIVENMFAKLNITDFEFEKNNENTTFHPGRCADIIVGGKICGTIGEVHPKVLENYSIGTKTYLCEMDFNTLLKHYKKDISYKHLPKFPAVSRDIAMLVDDEVNVGKIEKIIKKCSGIILEDVKLFDVYKGAQIPDGKKSVAYSVVFRSADHTLVDDEVTKVFNKIVKKLEDELGAMLR